MPRFGRSRIGGGVGAISCGWRCQPSLRPSASVLLKTDKNSAGCGYTLWHHLALEAIAQGLIKYRINPGNMKNREKLEEVVRTAKDKVCRSASALILALCVAKATAGSFLPYGKNRYAIL